MKFLTLTTLIMVSGALAMPITGKTINYDGLKGLAHPTNGRYSIRQDATENNIFVGVASSSDGNDRLPTATFRPEPGNQYQIQPSNVFYVATGSNLQVGQLLDPAKLGRQPMKIDFNVRSAVVTINHTPDGQLVVAK
ncbi:hypothetical protein FAGAP_5155 [Fusarium agapanthi]|uniref:Uncharacterized protein n=1 Tax=Fusarium agapanthi TaxID=1803897 RepID=A0A9P5BC16_9HYPO|nr:hypothetical protein FAGAP_5155 [Fusarium agapanthi]